MSVLVPGATADQQRALIAKLEMELARQIAEIDARFAGRTFRAADVSAEISRVAGILRNWYVIEYGGTYDKVQRFFFENERARLSQIGNMIGDIGDLQDFFTATELGYNVDAGYPPNYVFSSEDEQWSQLLSAEKAPIQWLAGVAPPTLSNFTDWNEALTEAAETAANIPSITLGWLLDQLFKSLKLPTWLIPVIGVTALVGVGTWAYFSFLAPIGAAGKVLRLRRNPRRRRHARRRRRKELTKW